MRTTITDAFAILAIRRPVFVVVAAILELVGLVLMIAVVPVLLIGGFVWYMFFTGPDEVAKVSDPQTPAVTAPVKPSRPVVAAAPKRQPTQAQKPLATRADPVDISEFDSPPLSRAGHIKAAKAAIRSFQSDDALRNIKYAMVYDLKESRSLGPDLVRLQRKFVESGLFKVSQSQDLGRFLRDVSEKYKHRWSSGDRRMHDIMNRAIQNVLDKN